MKTWHYLVAGYIGSFIWTLLAGIGGIFWGTSEFSISKQLSLTLEGAIMGGCMGIIFGLLFKRVEPSLIMFPRKLSAAIFWTVIAGAMAVVTQQMNFQDFRFYVGLAVAAIAGLCFEIVLTAFQKGRRSLTKCWRVSS